MPINARKSNTQFFGVLKKYLREISIFLFQMYLAQFGYLPAQMTNPNSGHLMTQEAMADAIREFQAFAGLNVTG